MDKKSIIDSIRNIVGWNYDRRQVSSVINHLYTTYIQSNLDRKIKDFDLLSKEYASQTVSEDAEGYYVTLPVGIIGLPKKTDGVLAIRNPSSGDFDYFPMSMDDVMFSNGMDSDTVNTYTGFYVVGSKIRLYNHTDSITTVTLVLAVQFDDFEDTDEVNLPNGKDYNIVEMAINMLLNKPPMDLKNDNR